MVDTIAGIVAEMRSYTAGNLHALPNDPDDYLVDWADRLAALSASGVVAPREPTKAMEDAAVDAAVNKARGRPWFPIAWAAALAAAPKVSEAVGGYNPGPLVRAALGVVFGTDPVPSAAGDAREAVPLNDDTKLIFGRMCFECISIAQGLRALGRDVPRRAESEQAAVIHWLLNIYLKHGAGWREAADAEMKQMAAALTQEQPHG